MIAWRLSAVPRCSQKYALAWYHPISEVHTSRHAATGAACEPRHSVCLPPQLLNDVIIAVQQQRAQAGSVCVLALEAPPCRYLSAGAHRVLDAYTDPYGWNAASTSCSTDCSQAVSSSTCSDASGLGSGQLCDLELLRGMLQQSRAAAPGADAPGTVAGAGSNASISGTTAGPGPGSSSSSSRQGQRGMTDGVCLIIDSLSTLLLRHPAWQVRTGLHTRCSVWGPTCLQGGQGCCLSFVQAAGAAGATDGSK